jgi:hypothetical protein
MKKLSTILALALVVALSASFAVSAEVESDKLEELGSVSKEVKFTVEDVTVDESVVYSVDVAWTDLSFTYNEGKLSWSPEDHDYTKADADAKWTDAEGSVTVTNHSNADVAVTVSFSDANADDGLSVEVDNGSFTLESAVGKKGQDGDSDVAALTAKGTPTASGKIGSIVVAIAAAN